MKLAKDVVKKPKIVALNMLFLTKAVRKISYISNWECSFEKFM